MPETYKPQEPWYVFLTKGCGEPSTVTLRLNDSRLLSICAPNRFSEPWRCVTSGMPDIELTGIDPYDESPETWKAAQALAASLIKKKLTEQMAELQQQIDVLNDLESGGETK